MWYFFEIALNCLIFSSMLPLCHLPSPYILLQNPIPPLPYLCDIISDTEGSASCRGFHCYALSYVLNPEVVKVKKKDWIF